MVLQGANLKVTGTVVNSNLQLIGLIIRGPGFMLGDIDNSTEVRERPFTIEMLAKLQFSNNQLLVADNGAIRIKQQSFRLNKIQTYMQSPNGIVPFDSTIMLTKKYVNDTGTIGFDVEIRAINLKKALRVNDIIIVSNWLHMGNYYISSNNKKQFIVLNDSNIPVQELLSKKSIKDSNKQDIHQNKVTEDTDIFDLFDFLNLNKSYIIHLPENKYNSTSKSEYTIADGFQALNIGEVAEPKLTFPTSKININAKFKKPGIVAVDGLPMPLFSFTWSEKHIFYNGESHMKQLGILLPKGTGQLLKQKFENTLAFKEITDENRIKPLANITGHRPSDMEMFEVDTTNLQLFASHKKYLLTNKQIREKQLSLYELELQAKMVSSRGKFVKEAAEHLTDTEKAQLSGKELFPLFRGMTDDVLERIKEAGINIYSGDYLLRTSLNADKKTEEKEKATVSPDIEIIYTVDKHNSKSLTFDKIMKYYNEDQTKLPQSVVILINTMLQYKTPWDKFKFCQEKSREIEKQVYKLRRELWIHKCYMMHINKNKTIHLHDRQAWDEIPTKKKTATDYRCNENGCEDLVLSCINIGLQ